MAHNISLLSVDKRTKIEMDKRASLLIYRLRRKEIKRGEILLEIENTEDSEKAIFKESLNKYKAMR